MSKNLKTLTKAMAKRLAFIFLLGLMTHSLWSQKYFTRNGNISFFSEAPLEKIEAHNNKVTSVIDLSSGKMEFAALIKAFQFEKALMQEHFNENYMESSKFPKATFKGSFTGFNLDDSSNEGTYPVSINGTMSIHGVSHEIETTGSFYVKNGVIGGDSNFTIKVEDYKIEIPSLVRDNIAREVDIHIKVEYQELKTN